MQAPMVPELGMDYLVEVEPGPIFTARPPWARCGSFCSWRGQRRHPRDQLPRRFVRVIKEIPELRSSAVEDDSQPVRTSIRVNLQQRVRELEEALMEERRAREQAEHLVDKRLEAEAERDHARRINVGEIKLATTGHD